MTKIIGHRGWRGKFPENSLIGFEQLALSGVHAVELDIVITKDKEILVSHEPWFDFQYCSAKKKANLYRLTTKQIQQVDCGRKTYEKFPLQHKFASVKPKFTSVLELWETLGARPFIALEVKSESKLYGSFQPFALEFAQILLDFEQKHLQPYDYFVQSFDPFFLKTYHQLNPNRKTGLLVENKNSVHENLDNLGYVPTFYNPEHILITEAVILELQKLNIKTHTWTVNRQEDFDRLLPYNLEGIISDYPERFRSQSAYIFFF